MRPARRAVPPPLALLALLAVPAAQAALVLHATVPADPVQPGTGIVTGAVSVSLDCPQVVVRTHGSTANTVPVNMAVVGPPELVGTINPVFDLPADPCRTAPQGVSQVQGNFSASLTTGAPAGRPVAFNVTASIAADSSAGSVAPADSQAVPLSLTARKLVLVTLDAPQAVHLVAANQSLTLRLANHGNVAVRVDGTLAFATSLASAAPVTVALGTAVLPASGPAEANATFLVHAPDRTQVSEFTGTARFEVHADDGTAGPPVVAALFFRDEVPAPKHSPAPAAAVVGLLLLGLAGPRRRA